MDTVQDGISLAHRLPLVQHSIIVPIFTRPSCGQEFSSGGGYSLGVWEQNPSVGSRGEDPGRKSENVDEVSKKPKQFADIVCRF